MVINLEVILTGIWTEIIIFSFGLFDLERRKAAAASQSKEHEEEEREEHRKVLRHFQGSLVQILSLLASRICVI